MVTTPRTCPASRRWNFGDTHAFADGAKDVFVSHLRCVRPKPKHRHRPQRRPHRDDDP